MNLLLLNRVLRSPADVAKDCQDDHDVAPLAATSLLAITVGALLFGASAGAWQGGAQTFYAAVKLPVVMLATLIVAAPAYYAVSAAMGRPASARTVLSLMLVAGARLSLVLLAAAPVVWLAVSFGGSYDLVKLIASVAYALAGLAALAILVKGTADGPGKRLTLLLLVGIFLLVGAQTAWCLRPYIGVPGEAHIPLFTNKHEGGLVYQLYDSLRILFGGGTR